MGQAAGIVVAAGSITAVNELLFSGAGSSSFNWRIIPATAGAALGLSLLERVAPGFARGLAWLSLAVVLIVPFGSAPTPLQNITSALGYTKAVT